MQNETPVYESDAVPLVNPFSDGLITYPFPEGGILANVVTVELIGKHAKQTQESGYYACVEKFDCRGIPFYAEAP